ncbi:MAG: hypothetical protein LBD29_07575 [Treponema sp.]|nr:hypothetical protein [Treponema sp.]
MMSDELKRLLIQVITSWQVIGVSVVLILYLSLVFYVARFQSVKIMVNVKSKGPKQKKEKKPAPPPEEEDPPEA